MTSLPQHTLLRVCDLAVGYAPKTILQGIDLSLNRGELLIVTGSNGSGKSTLIKTLAGILPPIAGKIYFQEQLLNGSAPYELLNKGIAYMPQGGLIMPELSVLDHFKLLITQQEKSFNLSLLNEIFDFFPKLESLLSTFAGNLSGGQRQMLSFGLLILQQSKLWLLDEPLAGLDKTTTAAVVSFIQAINQKQNISMLIIEHRYKAIAHLQHEKLVTDDVILQTQNLLL